MVWNAKVTVSELNPYSRTQFNCRTVMTHPGARFVNYNMIDSLFILTNYNSNMVTITLSKTLEKSIIYRVSVKDISE